MPVADYEPVIGLEVHAQLLTKSKIFCGCPTAFGAPPNTQVCAVCLGLPGALPALNREVVEMAIKAGKAFGCRIAHRSIFARKNYFYPDLPKGYQISQYETPLCLGGVVTVPLHDGGTRDINLTRIHIEEDAGKNVHGDSGSEVDLNRAGTPLIELVGEPELRSAEEATEYLKSLRLTLMYLGVNDGNMEEGSFRCDANVSVRKRGTEKFGTRVELKNINSFRFVRQAIDYEIERQVSVIESGGSIVLETRLFDHDKGVTRAMRSKEEANDYRYFPEPDLPPLLVSQAWIDSIEVPLLPRQLGAAMMTAGVSPANAQTLIENRPLLAIYQQAVLAGGAGSEERVSQVVVNEVARGMNEGVIHSAFAPSWIPEIFKLKDSNSISSTAAKEVLAEVLRSGKPPSQIVSEKGLSQVSDSSALEAVVDAVIAKSPGEAEKYRAGKKTLLGFFVGAAMRELKGKGNPTVLNALFKQRLGD